MMHLEQVLVLLLCSVAAVNSTQAQHTAAKHSPRLSTIFSDTFLNRRGVLAYDGGSFKSTWDMTRPGKRRHQLSQRLSTSIQPGKRGDPENNVLPPDDPQQDTDKNGTNTLKSQGVIETLQSSTGRPGAGTLSEHQGEQQKDEPSIEKQKKEEPCAEKQDKLSTGEQQRDELTAWRQFTLRPADDRLQTGISNTDLHDIATHRQHHVRPVVKKLLRDALTGKRHQLKASRQHGDRPAESSEPAEGGPADGRLWTTGPARDRAPGTDELVVQSPHGSQGLLDDISFNRTRRGTFPLLPDSHADRQSFFSPAETCRQRPMASVLWPLGCNPRLVRYSVCQGTCHSRAVPQWKMEQQELRVVTYCTCCSPQTLYYRRVRFNCPGKPSGQLILIQGVASQCACRPCSDAHPDLRQPYDY